MEAAIPKTMDRRQDSTWVPEAIAMTNPDRPESKISVNMEMLKIAKPITG